MKIEPDHRTSSKNKSPRSDFIKVNEVGSSRSLMSDSRDANTTKEPIKGSLNKKNVNLILTNRDTGKIVKQKGKPSKIKWKIKLMSRSPIRNSRDADTTKEPNKGSLTKKKLNLVQVNQIRNTEKILKRKRKPFKIKWKVKCMSENKTRVLTSNPRDTETKKRVHNSSKGSPTKKVKFNDLTKTKNKGKLIKVKIKQLKLTIGIAKNSKTWAHKVKPWSAVWKKIG